MKKKVISTKIYVFVLAVLFFTPSLNAQKNVDKETFRIETIPFELESVNNPLKVEIKNDSAIRLSSNGKTNLFNSPGDNYYRQNAPMLLFHPDSNFILRAKVTAELKEIYDVAALVVYQNNDLWAKLCFENSIDKETTIVSVVTRRYSDDCNSINIPDNFAYLSIAKKGKEFSFYYSSDNINWKLVRHFRLDCMENELMIGFTVHCSRGEMFSADFSDIEYTSDVLENMRRYK